jgi:succinate dehydrogenase / fumarate reductase, cytochrome b subunit
MSATPKVRPKYYDLNLLNLPPPGLVSIFHRITGAAMFLALIPLALFILQATLGGEAGYRWWQGIWANSLVKLIAVGFVWAYVHHFIAGIRYLLLDVHMGIAKEAARASARVVLVAGVIVTALIAWRIW